MQPPASKLELDHANRIRAEFLYPGEGMPLMNDIIRAFRAARGARSYVEVGSRDKGNVAWCSELLAEDAYIVEIDIDQNDIQAAHLRKFIKPTQHLTTITGDCLQSSLVDDVVSSLPDGKADIIFCDTLHWRSHALREVGLYKSLLAPDGIMFVHDAFYKGDEVDRGKADAFQELNRQFPVYSVLMDEGPCRFEPLSTSEVVWGGLAIIFA